MKLILFNGPPRSGKDTSTGMMLEALGLKAFSYRFASPLKNAVHALFGMHGIHEEGLSHVKDKKSDVFFGMSPREAYIWMSEYAAKPKFGKDFFAKVAVTNIRAKFIHETDATIVISDCGFQAEVDVLIAEFGRENVYIVHLHRMGCDFKKQNDSRGYIKHPDLEHMLFLRNDGTLEHLRDDIHNLMRRILQWNMPIPT